MAIQEDSDQFHNKGVITAKRNVVVDTWVHGYVVIRNLKTNFTTGSSGCFSFSGITSGGPYSPNFSRVGFENQALSGYNLKADATPVFPQNPGYN